MKPKSGGWDIAAGIHRDTQNAATPSVIGRGADGIHCLETEMENLGAVQRRPMVLFSTETATVTDADRKLEQLDRSIERVVLDRQDPISGLLPASTAHTVHGDYGDAWVRDCVLSLIHI